MKKMMLMTLGAGLLIGALSGTKAVQAETAPAASQQQLVSQSAANQANAVVQAGATLDGRPASSRYQSLEDLKNVFPDAVSLSQTLDELALQKVIKATPAKGTVQLPVGTLYISQVTLDKGITLQGSGDQSILQQTEASSGMLRAESQSSDTKIDGISLKNFKLQIPETDRTFDEHSHLLRFDGVKNLTIDGCNFYGFHGDAVYLGGGKDLSSGSTRHNDTVTIRNSTFDGINHANRNAISVIDGSHVTIASNSFYRTTADDMPGAIDIEPNANPESIVDTITVTDNKFEEIGGKLAVVGFSCSTATFKTTPKNITVANNQVSAPKATFFAFYTDTDGENNIKVSGNRGTVGRMIDLMSKTAGDRGVDGFTFEKNTFVTSAASLIGSDNASKKSQSRVDRVAIRDNQIELAADFSDPAYNHHLFHFTRSSQVDFSGNTISKAKKEILNFTVPQGISALTVKNNTISDSQASRLIAMVSGAVAESAYTQSGNSGISADLPG